MYTRLLLYIYLIVHVPDNYVYTQPSSITDLWSEIQEVSADYLEAAARDKSPENLFQPTSFLNPGYGVLFQHIGRLQQSVYKHYIVIALKIPTIKHVPHEPEEWYEGCDQGMKDLAFGFYANLTFGSVFYDHYCAKERIKDLYTEISETLHSTIPALLPNQVLPYAEYSFFNYTPSEMVNNKHANVPFRRSKRDVFNISYIEENIPLVEIRRALDYSSKYGKPLPQDADTIYASELQDPVPVRKKRFLGTLVRGIGRIVKGANVFGKVVKGIKKVGGFIFKGIKGLFHRRKNTALTQAIRAFGSKAHKFTLDKIYKFRKFKGLHLGKSSLATVLRRTWHKTKFWLRSKFASKFTNTLRDAYVVSRKFSLTVPDNRNIVNFTYLQKELDRLDFKFGKNFNYTNRLVSFLNDRIESIAYLDKIAVSLRNLVYGLEQLAMGKLTNTLLPPNILHKYLAKALREVRIAHPQFVPLYTELHHYYESKMNSYTNDDKYIYVQIPVFFTARNQPPLDLYRIHTVPVPLDKDTYDGKESKYTTLDLDHPYLATDGSEYMDITDAALDSCEVYHMDHLCENIHLTTDIQELTCAVAIYMDSIETTKWTPAVLNTIIQSKCNITYHEALYPQPTTLQTQDEILLANFRTYNWQLLCDDISDRPSRIQGALYTIVNLDDLCTCAIITPSGRYLYESMRSCEHPDEHITLHYTYNRPLISYDSSIDPNTAKRYATQPYAFTAPDLEYHRHEPYIASNGSVHARLKRHSPDDDGFQEALTSVTFPLPTAIRKMESKEPTYLGTLFPSQMAMMQSQMDATVTETESLDTTTKILDASNTSVVNLVFNIVTLINTTAYCCLLLFVRLSSRPGGWLNNLIVQIVQASLLQKTATALELLGGPTPGSTKSLLDLDDAELAIRLSPTQVPPTPSPTMLLQTKALISMLKGFAILGGILLLALVIWFLVKHVITPLSYKSSICRQLCVSCLQDDPERRPPSTDIFLDIVHVCSGLHIRIYLTTLSAPACALSFTGSVMLKNFKIDHRKLRLIVHIDWHNCLLLYNNFVLSLPSEGVAMPFQPNLLTRFDKEGPYNIVLLARHLDQLIPIPHVDETEHLPTVPKLEFPITKHPSPYQRIHDEVKALMPLAKSVASSSDSGDQSLGNMV